MKKLLIVAEFEYDDNLMHGDDREAKDWFMQVILSGNDLVLHSNEIGDYIGTIKVVEVKESKEDDDEQIRLHG